MGKGLLLNTLVVLSVAVSAFVIKSTHSCDCLTKIFLHDVSLQDRPALLRALLARIALFLFAHATAVMAIRIVTKKGNPASEEDPPTIRVLNRVITNTIEQTVIFGGLYAYFLLDVAGDRLSNQQLAAFACWFLLGRLVFSAGYLLGSLVGVSQLRAFGFALSVGANLLLIESIFLPVPLLAPFILT